MRLLTWFLQPTYVLLFIIGVVIFLNRITLFPVHKQSAEIQSVTGKVDSLIASLQSQQFNTQEEQKISPPQGDASEQTPRSEMAGDKTGEVPSSQTSTIVGGEAQVSSRSDPNSEYSDSMPSVSAEEEQTGLESADHIEADKKQTQSPLDDEQPAVTEQSDAPTQIEIPPYAENNEVVDNTVAKPQSAPAVSHEQLMHTWQQARIAAWYGNFSTAIDYYQTVITLQPTNYDAYGEMGNVMLQAGDWEGAAEAYYQAAHLLNQARQPQMAWNLLNVIAGLSPAKAEKLYQELMQQAPRH